MTYVSPPSSHPLGQRREKVEKLREDAGLDASGFREDGTDPLKEEKEEMLKRLYAQADRHLPPGLG